MWIEDGGTHAVKKGKQFPLPGWQQLTQNPGAGQVSSFFHILVTMISLIFAFLNRLSLQ